MRENYMNMGGKIVECEKVACKRPDIYVDVMSW